MVESIRTGEQMGQKLDKDWVIEKWDLLTRDADRIAAVGGDPATNFRELTVLKLSVLSAIVEVYTKIAPKDFDRCHYIDALSGPGVTQLRETEKYAIGSPILTPVMAHDIGHGMQGYHHIERDKDRRKALDRRLEFVREETTLDYPTDSAQTYQGDCNDVVPQILRQIKRDEDRGFSVRGVNILSFIDNSAFDAKWEMVRELARLRGDLVITFPPTRISRDKGRIDVLGEEYREQDINEFFGTDTWKDCDSEDEYTDLYMDRLRDPPESFDRINLKIRISTGPKGGRYYYYVIYSTAKTEQNSPYVEAIEHVKNRTERLTGGDVEDVVQMFIDGDQSPLDKFM